MLKVYYMLQQCKAVNLQATYVYAWKLLCAWTVEIDGRPNNFGIIIFRFPYYCLLQHGVVVFAQFTDVTTTHCRLIYRANCNVPGSKTTGPITNKLGLFLWCRQTVKIYLNSVLRDENDFPLRVFTNAFVNDNVVLFDPDSICTDQFNCVQGLFLSFLCSFCFT